MRKLIYAFVFLAAFAVAGTASAAVTLDQDVAFINGEQSATVRAGSTVKIGTQMDISSPDEVEYIQTRVFDLDGNELQAPDCDAVTPRLMNKTDVLVTNSVKLGSGLPDTPVRFERTTFGMAGVGVSNGCDPNNQNGFEDYEDVLFIDHDSALTNADQTVGGGSGSSSTPVGAPSEIDELVSKVNSLTALIHAYIEAQTAASTKPDCPPVYTGSNRIAVQTWLMAHGYASRFHAVGVYSPTEPGVIWGMVSSTTYADAQLACK